jgi:hypothetical protein
LNRDGKDDLVTANAYCRDGSGSATPQANCGSESNSISVLLNNGTGDPTNLFAPAANYATAPNPRSLAIGDFNEDRSYDIATANFNVNSVSILLNDGQGRFPDHAELASSTWPRSDAAGDVNGATGTGDGHTDLAVANQDSDNLNVYLGDGSGRFGDGSGAAGVATGTYATGSGPFWVTLGDLNRDGRQDAVTANYRDNTVSVLLNSTTPPPPPNFAVSVTALTPPSASVARGAAATFSVIIARTSLPGPVHLSVGGLPPSIRTTFAPNDTTGDSTLTASTGKATKPGIYRFTVTGSSGTLTRTATGQLTVTQK